jgi:hypothetical protein
MTEPATAKDQADAIKRLTVAVWLLSILVTVNILLSVVTLYFPGIIIQRIFSFEHPTHPDPYKDFETWPIDKKVAAASVIAIAKWQKSIQNMIRGQMK